MGDRWPVPVDDPEQGCDRPHGWPDGQEIARWEWRLGQAGNPAVLVQQFLAAHGLPVAELARSRWPRTDRWATLFISAAAAAHLIGAPVGAASPAPAVPDVVAVVWRPTPSPPPARGAFQLGRWRDSWTPQQHAAAITQVRQAISRGDVYQLNVVGHAAADYQGDPLPALRRLTRLPGARYPIVLTGAGWAVGCASPETLLTVEAGRMVTRPIKGTRPATAAGRTELVTSAKERAEHVMIVDLCRNDLAQVAQTGSVRVEQLYAVRRWCHLWQAESVVSAVPAAGVGLADVLTAVCPGGSVTGAPKLAALALIAALEPVGRGPAMGLLGWIGPDRIDLGVTIRTAAADSQRLHVWAGGGITWDSDPQEEVAEAVAKAAPLRAALAGSAVGAEHRPPHQRGQIGAVG